MNHTNADTIRLEFMIQNELNVYYDRDEKGYKVMGDSYTQEDAYSDARLAIDVAMDEMISYS